MRTGMRAIADMVGRLASRGQEAQRGQTLAEYSLILGFLAVSVILSLAFLGGITTGVFWDPINRVFTEAVDLFTP